LASFVALSLVATFTLAMFSTLSNKVSTEAASPTFWLNVTSTQNGFPTAMELKLDADAEGNGVIGTEVNISYDSNKVTIGSVDFQGCVFDSCIDLSEAGTLKLLAVSGLPANGGTLVTGQNTFAAINVSMSEAATFTFTKCQVIDPASNLVNCSSTNLTVNPGATCGNGVLEGIEECDDGNINDGDGCSATCTIEAVCGNGVTEGAEECDDGNVSDGDGCSSTCAFETVCGNGVAEGIEECDDGNASDNDACLNNCISAVCGDGNVQFGTEACDDGNAVDGDGCSSACQLEAAVCGNGAIEGSETCDDGNAVDGDGCSSVCVLEVIEVPVCGNNVVEGSEECDDGNNTNGDGCSASCLSEAPPVPTLTSLVLFSSAGTTIQTSNSSALSARALYDDDSSNSTPSGVIYTTSNSGVASVSGNQVLGVSDGTTIIGASYTENDVTKGASFLLTVFSPPPPALCGDFVLAGSEACDDGNTITETCVYGATACTVCDSTCNEVAGSTTYCGDNILNGPEECDDGNTVDGDGCSATCVVEVLPPPPPEEPVIEEPEVEEPVIEEPVIEEPEVFPSAPESGGIIETETTEELQQALQTTSFSGKEMIEQRAVEEAEAVIDAGEIIEEQEVMIAAPATQQEVLTRIDFCKLNPDYAGADFDDQTADTDRDGLTDRTECYADTHPLIADSDNDGFSDGDEVNVLSSDPTVADAPKSALELILISDPQPGWILGNKAPRVAGMAAMRTRAVTVIAVHADQKLIRQLGSALSDLLSAEGDADVLMNRLTDAIQSTDAFIAKNSDFFDYTGLLNVLTTLKNTNVKSKTALEAMLIALNELRKESIVLGSTDAFSEMFLGDDRVKRFEFAASDELEDRKLYDLVATATLNGKTLSSVGVRIGVNTGLTITNPIPRTLGETPILANLEVEIDEERPVVSGDTEFGSHVFAIWNSLVLASSIISDSEEGTFSLQAPQTLEADVPHRVTLYSVKTDGDNTLRSESVDVYFTITPLVAVDRGRLAVMAISALVALITLILISYLQFRRKKKSVIGLEESGKSAAGSAHVFEHFFRDYPEGLRSAAPEGPAEKPETPEVPVEGPAEKPTDESTADQSSRESIDDIVKNYVQEPNKGSDIKPTGQKTKTQELDQPEPSKTDESSQ